MLELCTSAYQGAFDADSIRIANGGYDEVAQIETSRSLLLPIVEAAQGVGKIDAAVKICHLAAEVNIGHSVWDGGKPRTAGIAKEVAIHAVQGCRVAHLERLPHRPQAAVTYRLPPAGGAICVPGRLRMFDGSVVGCADSIQNCVIVTVVVSSAGKSCCHILQLITWISCEFFVATIRKVAHFKTR